MPLNLELKICIIELRFIYLLSYIIISFNWFVKRDFLICYLVLYFGMQLAFLRA